MTLVNRILIPVDFSDCSKRALEYASELSSRLKAPLLLAHVFVHPVVYMPAEVWTLTASLEEARVELARELEALATQARALGAVEVGATLVEGEPSHAIVGIAQARHCDLIVMGTHGRTGLKHVLLGSVAEKIVRGAHCPVVTVGPRAATKPA